MTERPVSPARSRIASIIVVVALLSAFVLWTLLLLHWPPLAELDRQLVATPPAPDSAEAQILAAFALLTWPGIEYTALVIIAIWAYRRRLRALAGALVTTFALGWASTDLLKPLIGKPRPADHLDLITNTGYGYPSGHMVGAVATCIAIGATLRVTRRSPAIRLGWYIGSVWLVLTVALDRWLLAAHSIGDIIGGALLGATVATFSLVVWRVSVPMPPASVVDIVRDLRDPPPEPTIPPRRCAVIFNPAKVTDWTVFRRHVEYELRARGWAKPIWLETTIEDPGWEMTARAVAERVDLVLGAGGDGTIRVICSGLANTGIPFGLIPAGTGNLLARNLGIPLDEAAALSVAFDGRERNLDLIRLSTDGGRSEHFAVMAGVGIDAVIMQDTNPDLKRTVGSAAYFVSAAKNANHPPLQAVIRVDNQPPFRRKAAVIVVGNVGMLTSGILLIPDAKPDDGLLNLLVASPRGIRDWVRLFTRVLARQQGSDDPQLDRIAARRVEIRVNPRDQYQLDGDTVGDCAVLVAEVDPGALIVRVPPAIPQPRSMAAGGQSDSLGSIAVDDGNPVPAA